MRTAIYARFSSDLQRDASIEDQVRVCTALAERLGGTVVEVFSDYAVSGATHLRPAFQQMLMALRDGRVDVVVAEALDRISRDQEHIAAFYKQVIFAKAKLITVGEGEITELHVGLKGTMNALFLKDLGMKVHRGIEGRVRHGSSAGGNAYGYRVIRELNARGELIRGGRQIDPAEAAIITRIFTDFAAGHSAIAIAKTLNAEGIPSPTGGAWQDTTLRGCSKRGSGILRNALYVGRRVWNQNHHVKDPATGRRLSRPNPKSEWVIEDVPDLRIIDLDLWERVQLRLNKAGRSQSNVTTPFWSHRRAKHLLTGKAYCGCCGGTLGAAGQDYLACTRARGKGICSNTLGVRRRTIEALILDALKSRLMAPELVKEFADAFIAETNRLRAEADCSRAGIEKEHTQVSRKLTGLIDAIADGFRASGLQEQLDDLESRKAQLERKLSEPHMPLPRIHPNLSEIYRAKVADLHLALADPATRTEAIEIIRALIERVELHPMKGGGFEIELVGDIANMIKLGTDAKKTAPNGVGVLDMYRRSVKVASGN